MKRAIALVVTGLPASGKTTIAKQLADALGWPLLDKDDILEHLFEGNPVYSSDDRRQLSRMSDVMFQEEAKTYDQTVLVSHWRPRHGPSDTGTPTSWLTTTYQHIVEIHCECAPQTATNRFLMRNRHPSHLDSLRTPADIASQIDSLRGGYPLEVGQTISINTEKTSGISEIIKCIKLLKSETISFVNIVGDGN